MNDIFGLTGTFVTWDMILADLCHIYIFFFGVGNFVGICATIRTRREIQCLPYVRFKRIQSVNDLEIMTQPRPATPDL